MLKQTLLITVAILTFNTHYAQINVGDTSVGNTINNILGVNGEPVLVNKYYRVVEGSVFAPESFTKARIFIRNNRREVRAEARLNIIEEMLHYKNDNGKEIIATVPVDEVQFFTPSGGTMVFSWGIPECPQAKGWFEVLEKGKANLFRKHVKVINEVKPYGSATAEQKVVTTYTYWYQVGNTCKPVRKISELREELAVLNPAVLKKTSGKLSDKKTEDWLSVVRAFNEQ